MFNKSYGLLISAFLLSSAILIIINLSNKRISDPIIIVENFKANLAKQSLLMTELVLEYETVLSKDVDDYWPLLEKLHPSKSIYAFVYKDSNLLFWNTSQILFDNSTPLVDSFLFNDHQNWFLGKYSHVNGFHIYLLKAIEINYNVENQYVNHEVSSDFSHFNELYINYVKTESNYSIANFGGEEYYLEIGKEKYNYTSSYHTFILLLLWFSLLCLLIFKFANYLTSKFENVVFDLVLGLLFTFIIRFIDWYLDLSYQFVHADILHDEVLSIPLFNTIGDIILSAIAILTFVILLYKRAVTLSHRLITNSRLNQLVAYLILGTIPYVILTMTSSLIQNLGFTQLYFFINGYTGLFVTIILIIFGSIIYLTLRFVGVLISVVKFSILIFIVSLASVLQIELIFSLGYLNLFLLSVVLSILAILTELIISKRKQFYVLHHLMYIIVISVMFSMLLNQAVETNKSLKQNQISSFLSQTGDKAVEEFWFELSTQFDHDNYLTSIIDNTDLNVKNSIYNYLINTYFSELDHQLSYQITVCAAEDLLDLESSGSIVNCDNFFNEMSLSSIKTIGNDLFLIDNEPDNIYYLSKYQLSSDLTLYIEFFSFFVPTGLGYAELLVDRKDDTPDLSSFSFAKYHDDILISKFGSFEYHTNSNNIKMHKDSTYYYTGNYKHYKVLTSNNDILIVSRPVERLSSKMISFSSLFLLFAFTFMLLTFAIYGSSLRQRFSLNFRARLQLFFMIALSSILVTTALIIMFYAEKNSTDRLQDELNEKAHSVLIELQHKLSDHTSLDNVNEEDLELLLQKFSLVFFSDINLYDKEGRIIASSRPQIFEQGFLSEMVNPRAYEEIFVDNLLYFNCTENIGDLEYYSSYLPLMLTNGEPAGIINLPYFARHKEQRRSFRFLLFTFINLFVILGIIGTIIAIFYSRILTKPLTELQKSIANIRIDMHNAKIEWQSDDEIGQLINEHNKMVDKLEASAEILKHSEREIAWREVARQIAHEIKNPLTPMKLNIQYLEKSYRENDAEFSAKLSDISKTLIQQIDTLDKVAETFSDMAKTNIRNFKEIELKEIIEASVKLFDTSNNISFEIINEDSKAEYFTKGILKEINQIFNNLLKNSVEAIGSKEDGRILIELSKGDAYHTIRISDNGSGVPENMTDMVFTPYFTTRSKGTGLGLAIVKTIITNMGGNIKLESTNSEGTTFILKFLKTK